MKTKAIFRNVVVSILTIGLLSCSTAFSQTSKSYRRPSESDIEWLLGGGKPKTPQRTADCGQILQASYYEIKSNRCAEEPEPAACKPVLKSNCDGLKNPACTCTNCASSRPCEKACLPPCPPTPRPPRKVAPSPIPAKPLETADIDVDGHVLPVVAIPPDTITQAAGETLASPGSPEEFPADVDEVVSPSTPVATGGPVGNSVVLPPKSPVRTPIKANGVLEAPPAPKVAAKSVVLPKSCTPAIPVREPDCRTACTTGTTCTSSFADGDDCSCNRCRGCADEIVASTWIGDCLRKMSCIYTARTRHGDCCSCWLCADLDHPDMIGDAAWLQGRFVGFYRDSDSVAQSIPTALLSRLNIAEHFNAEVRDRFWFDWRHMNNATSLYGVQTGNASAKNGDVDQFTFGFEKRLFGCDSLEVRVPLFNQFGSDFAFANFGESKTEIGNISLIYKYLFTRNAYFTYTGGIGIVFPTADDWKAKEYGLSLKNKAYYLVPYLGVQWHPNDSTFGHALVQVDLPLADNELCYGGQMRKAEEQTVIRVGVQIGRWFYRNERGMHSCRLGGFLEVDYASATEDARNVSVFQNAFSGNHVFLGTSEKKAQSVNLVAGLPILFGQLAISNAVIVPLTSNDRQFSVAYNFAVSRRF